LETSQSARQDPKVRPARTHFFLGFASIVGEVSDIRTQLSDYGTVLGMGGAFGSFGALSDSQQVRLDEIATGLTEREKAGLHALAMLRNMEASWRADRYATIYAAAQALDAGLLPLDVVLNALDVSRTTWVRRRSELQEWLAGHPAPTVTAAGDQAAAAARHLGDLDPEGDL
jgi:hypothetical protein